MASSSSDLSKMQKDMEDLLALHGKSLYDKIQTFPAQAKKRFIDQVTRRIVPQPNDVALYIEQGDLTKFFDTMRSWGLAHAHLDDVLAHIRETLYCFPWMKSDPVANLLNLTGDVEYIYKGNSFKAFITIYLPESYPKDPPQAWVVCEDGITGINHKQMHVAANGSVSIPYLWDWDGKSSTLLQFILHMSVEFTSQPPTFVIDVGIYLSDNQRELLKIIIDYGIMHLYDEIFKITPARTYAFFDEVARRYPPVLVDLAGHIRTSKRGVKNFIDIVAELLGQPSKTISKNMFITILVVRVLVVIRVTLEHVTFLRSETKKSTNHSRPALERVQRFLLHCNTQRLTRLVEGEGAYTPTVGFMSGRDVTVGEATMSMSITVKVTKRLGLVAPLESLGSEYG
uniref:UEV domain-containing protein n=1 Tax=Brassica campestris TaxID=3711 RepID=M4CVK1_BRACM